MSQQNIDRLCAEIGFSVPQRGASKNIIQKALGVISQDGIFAYVVWLESRNSLNPSTNNVDDITAKNMHEKSCELLKRMKLIGEGIDYKSLRDELARSNGILEDIHQMFLVKHVFERMLTYALYRAKSLP